LFSVETYFLIQIPLSTSIFIQSNTIPNMKIVVTQNIPIYLIFLNPTISCISIYKLSNYLYISSPMDATSVY
jgi:hypothetical protein